MQENGFDTLSWMSTCLLIAISACIAGINATSVLCASIVIKSLVELSDGNLVQRRISRLRSVVETAGRFNSFFGRYDILYKTTSAIPNSV